MIEIYKSQIHIVDSLLTASAGGYNKENRFIFVKLAADGSNASEANKFYTWNATKNDYEIVPLEDCIYVGDLAEDTLPTATATKEGQLAVAIVDENVVLFAAVKSGDAFVWKQVAGGGGASVFLINGTPTTSTEGLEKAKAGAIAIDTSKKVLYYFDGSAWISTQEFINISEVNNVYGRFVKGESYTNKTNQEMWAMLLTADLKPTITAPSVSITVKDGSSNISNNKLYEIGKTCANFSVVASYSDGSVAQTWGGITEQSSSIAGAATKYTYSGDDIGTPASDTATTCSISSFVVAEGTQGGWSVKADYAKGSHTPVDNSGSTYYGDYAEKFGDDGYWAASSVTSSTVNIIGVYPIYGTTVNTTTLTKQTLCQKPASNANVTFAMKGDNGPGGTRWSFAIPSTWSVKGIRNAGGTPFGGTDASSLGQWSQETKTLKTIDSNSTLETSYVVWTRDVASDKPGDQSIQVVLN